MTREWLYPTIVVHRGGGSLAPENTLAAIDTGVRYDQQMIEVDAKLFADGQIFLLHDDTLERTSQGSGIAGLLDWQTLLQIEAGEWFDEAFRGERLPLLSSVAERCRQHGLAINIEIKPTTGTDEETGRAVALAARQLWQGMTSPPLLSSFSPSALAGQFACRALHLQHEALAEDRVEAIKASGLHIMA